MSCDIYDNLGECHGCRDRYADGRQIATLYGDNDRPAIVVTAKVYTGQDSWRYPMSQNIHS